MHRLGEKGVLILAGRTILDLDDENMFGIALINANSLEEAKRIMEKDPGVLHGIQESEIYPFSMSIKYLENALS